MTSRLTSSQQASSQPSTVTNNGLTQFQQNVKGTCAAPISGTGVVDKDGPGALTLAPGGAGHRGKTHLLASASAMVSRSSVNAPSLPTQPGSTSATQRSGSLTRGVRSSRLQSCRKKVRWR